MLEPRLLFLSQPTWGVDIGAATAIRQRLLDLRDAGVAILVISEELEPSLTTADVTPNDIGEYMIGHSDTASEEAQHAS